MPVGCPHGKSRGPLPAIRSASSMSNRMPIITGTRRRANLPGTSHLRRRRRRCRQRRSRPLQCQGRPQTLDFSNVRLVISLERLTKRCHLKMLLSLGLRAVADFDYEFLCVSALAESITDSSLHMILDSARGSTDYHAPPGRAKLRRHGTV